MGTPSKTETPKIPEFPGWYINFQTAVLKQLPRPGQIDQATAEEWERNQESLKNILSEDLLSRAEEKASLPALDPAALARPREKFTKEPILVVKVTVPGDYNPGTHLATFDAENRSKFYDYNNHLTDENFARVTHRLVPGRTYTVKIFGITSGEVATSDECLAKYQAEKALYTGAQGVSLVWKQHRKQLPKGKWYASFDEEDKLPVADGDHWVPYVYAYSGGDFRFRLRHFEFDWRDRYCLVCFCDEESQPSGPSTLQK